MKPSASITVPEVLDLFANYYEKHKNWNELSLVLLKANYNNDCAKFCLDEALKKNNPETIELAQILVKLSPTQRKKISQMF